MFNTKIPAGSLPYVIALSYFSLLLLSGFIGWIYFSQNIKTVSFIHITKEKASRQALLERLKSTPKESAFFNSSNLQYFYHGIIPIITDNNQGVKSGAMIGHTPLYKNLAFFLPDLGNTLYLGINTPIHGAIYAPRNGIRSSLIGQTKKRITQDYTLQKSASTLPRIKTSLTQQLDTLLNPILWEHTGHSTIPDKSHNSFFAPTLIIELNHPTTLEKVELIGNIWIRSTAPIVVSASSKLIDVVISAPVIVFEEGFSGQVQAIASERIDVASACHFSYPSALWVHKKTEDDVAPSGQILLAQHTEVNGYIGMTSFTPPKTSETNISIGPQTKINGLVYCAGTLSLEGQVYGSVFTQNIAFQQQGIRYINHLLQGRIDGKARPYGALDIGFENHEIQKVIQWLY